MAVDRQYMYLLDGMGEYSVSEQGMAEILFDILEPLYLIYADWGEYWMGGLFLELEFRPSPMLTYDSLSEVSKELYDLINEALEEKYGTPTSGSEHD